jgi:hypothetical protein
MPLQATSGAASYDAFGGGVAAVPNYIEDVFSTWLYQSNDSGQTITNGIDLAGEGGLVWTKPRGQSGNHILLDTVRGGGNALYSNTTQATDDIGSGGITSFNSNGYTGGYNLNINNNIAWCSWTFREQPKFFDVVTWTGNNTYRNISHNLGSVPGCIIVKVTNGTSSWIVYHRSLGQSFGADNTLELNTTSASIAGGWGDYANPTTTTFFVPPTAGLNATGETYVAYLFAHNAGGFGLTGTDNVISCGSYSGTGSAGNNVTLGYEPQWVMFKATNDTTEWSIADVMRGTSYSGTNWLYANLSDSEDATTSQVVPTATGFTLTGGSNACNGASRTYIYIAIRRGPMKVPTTGTSVFSPVTYTGNGATTQTLTSPGFPVDFTFSLNRGSVDNKSSFARLRGTSDLMTNNTEPENPGVAPNYFDRTNLGIFLGNSGVVNNNGDSYVAECFRRAPGFFDVVCYTGTGSATTFAHNLAAVPELMIVKCRSDGFTNWTVYSSQTGATNFLTLNSTNAVNSSTGNWNNTAPTASVFTVATNPGVNTSARTYVNYLFATCPGVSKVFNFTGNGSSQTINCGFTGGARFVMIKRTDSTGDWYVWDSARGIVSGNDPRLSLNTTAAEVTTDDSVDTDSTGFVVNQLSATNVNVNGASYIGLAIA